jgi:hypothetical protein
MWVVLGMSEVSLGVREKLTVPVPVTIAEFAPVIAKNRQQNEVAEAISRLSSAVLGTPIHNGRPQFTK